MTFLIFNSGYADIFRGFKQDIGVNWVNILKMFKVCNIDTQKTPVNVVLKSFFANVEQLFIHQMPEQCT